MQIANALGAHVTGVCSSRNVDLVQSLGADEVIDYKQENYTVGDQRFDVIIDNVGNHPLLANRRALEPDGRYISDRRRRTGRRPMDRADDQAAAGVPDFGHSFPNEWNSCSRS